MDGSSNDAEEEALTCAIDTSLSPPVGGSRTRRYGCGPRQHEPMRPTLAALAVLFVIATSPGVSLAADSNTSDTVGEARAHEGADALEKGDFEAARLAFAQAYAVDPRPGYLWGLAVAEGKTNRPLDALGHLRIFLQSLPAGESDDRRKAEALLAEEATHVGHVRIEAPEGARIAIDGGPNVGVSPLPGPVDVTPGRHTLQAQLGAESASTAVSPGAGETVVWQLQFEHVHPVAPPRAVARTVLPAENRPTKKPAASTRWVVSAGMLVGGLASFAVFGGFLAASSDENSKWAVLNLETGTCPQPPTTAQCQSLKSAADSRAADQNIAVGFGVAGGALIVAGIVNLLVWPEPHREAPRTSWAPVVAPGFAGAQWSAHF
jgi:hypothetical protein